MSYPEFDDPNAPPTRNPCYYAALSVSKLVKACPDPSAVFWGGECPMIYWRHYNNYLSVDLHPDGENTWAYTNGDILVGGVWECQNEIPTDLQEYLNLINKIRL